MKIRIQELLEQGKVDAFLGYKRVRGIEFPYIFTKDNMDKLEPWRPFDVRYPIVKLLLEQVRKHPTWRFAVLVRGCEERAINELYKWNQLEPDRIICLGQACSAELASYCECQRPWPTRVDYGEQVAPVSTSLRLDHLERMPANERLGWWLKEFNRCMRCLGCRDICPMCFCRECSLENEELLCTDKIPPDVSFHLIRAVHLAGRCVDCGLCEEICPAGIPLRVLYKKLNTVVEELFDYIPGGEHGKSPLSFLGAEAAGSLSQE